MGISSLSGPHMSFTHIWPHSRDSPHALIRSPSPLRGISELAWTFLPAVMVLLRADKRIASQPQCKLHHYLSLTGDLIRKECWGKSLFSCWCCCRHGLLSVGMTTGIGLCNKIIQAFLRASSEASTISYSSKEACLPSPWRNTSCVFWSFQSFISFLCIWWNRMR